MNLAEVWSHLEADTRIADVPGRVQRRLLPSGRRNMFLGLEILSSSPSEDYLAVLAGQRQWIVTTNFAGCPGQPQIALRIAPCSLPWQSS